jgi:stage II sporulation protein AA (anti-sigma F factor antagonist)
MKIQAKKEENTLIVSLDGKIDGATAPELEAELIGWLDQGETALILDLREVFYVSSAGLRVVLLAAKRLRSGGRLAIAEVQSEVKEIFDLAGFDTLLPFYDDLGAAKKSFPKV